IICTRCLSPHRGSAAFSYFVAATSAVYTLSLHTLFRSAYARRAGRSSAGSVCRRIAPGARGAGRHHRPVQQRRPVGRDFLEFLRSEEHTSELQSRENLVCRLLLEEKKSESA